MKSSKSKKTTQKVPDQSLNFETLLQVTEAVLSTLDLEEILQQITRQAVNTLKATRAVLFLRPSEHQNHVELVSEFDVRELNVAELDVVEKDRMFHFDHHSPTRVVMETQQTYQFHVDDSDTDIRKTVRESLLNMNIKSVLMVPLIHHNRAIGLFAVDQADNKRVFTDEEIYIAKILANQATIAIKNAELFKSVQEEKSQIEVIINSSPDGIVVCDHDNKVEIVNPTFTKKFSIESSQILGKELNLFFSELNYQIEKEKSVDNDQDDLVNERYKVISKSHDRCFHVLSSPFVDTNQKKKKGKLLIFRDITQEEHIRRMKEDLTQMVVHDLKNPLSAIMAYIESITSGILGEVNDRQNNFLNRAYSNASLLLNMISDILDIYRMEEKAVVLRLAPKNITALIAKAISQLEGDLESKKISLIKDFDPVSVTSIDEDIMVRICINLLHNAIKYSPTNGTLHIKLFEQNGFIHVQIKDQGPGIPKHYHDQIFEKFIQVRDDNIHHRLSSGLGLTFCKLMVNAHKGEIWVESEVGKGSTFIFTLPVK